jgi:hypothetical protein
MSQWLGNLVLQNIQDDGLGCFSHPCFHRQILLTFSMREAYKSYEWPIWFFKICLKRLRKILTDNGEAPVG